MSLGTPRPARGRPPAPTPGPEPRRFFALVPRAAILVIFLAVLASTLSYGFLRGSTSLQPGSVCPEDFTATRTDVDEYRTAELRRQAAAAVADHYRFDPGISTAVATYLDELIMSVSEVLEDPELDAEARVTALAGTLPGDPSGPVTEQLAEIDVDAWNEIAGTVRDSTVAVAEQEFDSEGLPGARQELLSALSTLPVADELRAYLAGVAQKQLAPTLVFDEAETERLRAEAADAVEEVVVLKGQIIARRGDILTEHQVVLIREMALVRTSLDPRTVSGAVLMTLVLVGSVVLYLRLYEGDVFKNASQLLLLAIVVSLVLIITQFTKGVSPYLAPVALGAMLITSLLGPTIAIFVTFVLSVGIGLSIGIDLRYAMVALTGGMVGVFSLSWVGQRSDLTRAGFLVGLTNVVTIVAFDLIGGVSLADFKAWQDLGFGFLNGIASAVLAIGTLPFFESAFGILTSVRLLELANPNQPLLRRLLVEAPGTYHHSVVVGNLAEAGADAAGGNGLLARVGAYYHDIGKINRPYFFIENQMGQENPHDRISASLSALIITSHVKDGVALAEEAKLPPQVISFIRSHHGKSLISYFYNRASEDDPDGRFGEDDFRYEGPLPETREEALVMLADSCEAAVRSMSEPDGSRIDALVRKIIRERLVDGQLERCDLTLRDLDRVAEVFVRVLVGIFHARIEYPEDSERLIEEMKGAAADGGAEGAPERKPRRQTADRESEDPADGEPQAAVENGTGSEPGRSKPAGSEPAGSKPAGDEDPEGGRLPGRGPAGT